ncbi:MAG: iron-sulfur cluster co-chaperone HscB C-terminal domain-containing protein [Phycisphaerales bacterium]
MSAPPDPFETLGLPARFDLDQAAIEQAYLSRTTAAFGPGGGAGGTRSAGGVGVGEPDPAIAARLNQARATLRDPEQRANALLARLGGPAKETDRSLPAGFLQEMMDVRERLEAQRHDPQAIDRWEVWGERRRREHIAGVRELFARLEPGGGGPADPAVLALIRQRLNAWRYIERMLEQVRSDEGASG